MGKKKFLITIAGIIVLAVVILVALLTSQKAQPEKVINVITEKTEYQIGDALKVNIENNLEQNICFSSCFPYYFEKKDGEWNSYNYVSCPDNNLVERCISPKKTKGFEIVIPVIDEGLHRLALPACVGCELQKTFKEDQWLYSNEFIVR